MANFWFKNGTCRVEGQRRLFTSRYEIVTSPVGQGVRARGLRRCDARGQSRSASCEQSPTATPFTKVSMNPLKCFLFDAMIAPRCFAHTARFFGTSPSAIPLKGSYTAITEQLWRQRELAKNRVATLPAAAKSADCGGVTPKIQCETMVMYDFPGNPTLKDEYSNPWGDVRCA